ncbi:MAG TPA: hypothetical protein VKO38_01820, partial [Wenzhouxiangella sp.]|nr:hypothetical protein [Wenzhouxiangella sp.]
ELYQDIEAGRYAVLLTPSLAILILIIAVLAYPISWAGRSLDGQASEHAAQRRLSWFAALLMLGGTAALLIAVIQTFSRSVAMLALGLVGPTAWITPPIVLGVLIAVLALIQVIGKTRDTGTVTGIALVLCAGIALSVSLTMLGVLF